MHESHPREGSGTYWVDRALAAEQKLRKLEATRRGPWLRSILRRGRHLTYDLESWVSLEYLLDMADLADAEDGERVL